MNGLLIGLLIFQLIVSMDYVFPDLWDNVLQWHIELFEPLE